MLKLSEAQEREYADRINEGNSEKIRFQSRIVTIGICISVIVAGMVFVWALYEKEMVQFKDVLTTLLVGFACTTLVYASKTFEHNRYVNIYRIHLDATKAESDARSSLHRREESAKMLAFDLMKDWHSAEMIFHASNARNFFETKPSDIAAVLSEPESAEVRRSIMVVLNYFERVGLAIQTNLADNSLLKSYFRGLFYTYHSRLEGYITKRRAEPDSHRLFLQYTSTINRWRMEEN